MIRVATGTSGCRLHSEAGTALSQLLLEDLGGALGLAPVLLVAERVTVCIEVATVGGAAPLVLAEGALLLLPRPFLVRLVHFHRAHQLRFPLLPGRWLSMMFFLQWAEGLTLASLVAFNIAILEILQKLLRLLLLWLL